MRRRTLIEEVSWLALIAGVAVLLAACGASSSSGSSTPTTAKATKAGFCAGNDALDRGTASLSPLSAGPAIVAALTAHQADIDQMAAHYPPGQIGAEAAQVVDALRTAVATGSAANLNGPTLMKDAADLDSYCGVDQYGNPLPANFGAGRNTAFCNAETTLENGLRAAPSPAAALDLLRSSTADMATFNANVSHLPAGLQAYAHTLANAANRALASGNTAFLATPDVLDAANRVALYCGVNH